MKLQSQAVIDGDAILGTILATSIRQSSNKVPITVPYSPSQVELYHGVLEKAGVSPEDITYLEAHGTGTPIGDPQEFAGIQEIFACGDRQSPLFFASLKGNIGHTEGASGVAGLIKVILMMQHHAIPRQANYRITNPQINLIETKIQIPTQTEAWAAARPTACISNYGAAGSIAAIVVRGAVVSSSEGQVCREKILSKYPVVITANSTSSLRDNCAKLRQFLPMHTQSTKPLSLPDIAFNICDRQNRSLPHIFAATVSSITEMDQHLHAAELFPDASVAHTNNPGSRPSPVILVFGGQTNRHVPLSRNAYNSSALLRKHLDECHDVLVQIGYDNLYLGLFDSTPTDDVVSLQTKQFALQYACARAWIDCGLEVQCVVGHSFGQFVALTVAGVLSLFDGLKFVYGRAILMRDSWGPERGSMVALNCGIECVTRLMLSVKMADPSARLEVACYNSPGSHVLVGSVPEVNALVDVIKRTTKIKYKVLDVTHGFHSRFCDSIRADLEELASSLTFNSPKIRLETCSRFESWNDFTAERIASHTRDPVYFGEAVKRAEARYGSCTWLEAGSGSSVIPMVRSVLTDGAHKGHFYYPVDLSRDDAMNKLADTTSNMWKQGHNVQFWPFHRSQRQNYNYINLPPYQFEKRDHWLHFNLKSQNIVQENPSTGEATYNKPDPVLIVLNGFEDALKRQAVFTIDPRCDEWKTLVMGHAVLEQPVCPASLYVELAQRAAKSLVSDRGLPVISFSRFRKIDIASSLGLDPKGNVFLKVTQSDEAGLRWHFELHSGKESPKRTRQITKHASGEIELIFSHENLVDDELQRFRRVLQPSRFESLISHENSEAIQGNSVYNTFSRVVTYHNFYRGIRRISALEDTIAAEVVLKDQPPALLGDLLTNPVALDNFLQVPGLYFNCIAPCRPQEAFVCVEMQSLQLSSDFLLGSKRDVFATAAPMDSDHMQQRTCDIFATESNTGNLVFAAFGVKYEKIPMSLFAKTLSRNEQLNALVTTDSLSLARQVEDGRSVAFDSTPVRNRVEQAPDGKIAPKPSMTLPQVHIRSTEASMPSELQPIHSKTTSSAYHQRQHMERRLLNLLSEMFEVSPNGLVGQSSLDEFGIDSLLMMEVGSEIESAFGILIPQGTLQSLRNVSSVVDYLYGHGGPSSFRGLADELAVSSNVEDMEHVATTTSSPSTLLHSPETPTELSGKTLRQVGEVSSRLAKILGTHLDCSATEFHAATDLADKGLDSLLWMEVISDIEELFDVTIDLNLTTGSKYGELCDKLVEAIGHHCSSRTSPSPLFQSSRSAEIDMDLTKNHSTSVSSPDSDSRKANPWKGLPFVNAADDFESIKPEFDKLADKYHFKRFFAEVYDKNTRLVLAYTVEAFADLGVHLDRLAPGDTIPLLNVSPRHYQLREVLYEILREGQVAHNNGKDHVRSETPMQRANSAALFKQIVSNFPYHAKEHALLDACGSNLAKLLTGSLDPLKLIFGTRANRDTLEDVYSTSPMYVIMSQLLTTFLEKVLGDSRPIGDGPFRIIELGAGTGSTTRWVVDRLVQQGVPIEYTFTDISSSLVSAAKRKFQKYKCMKYSTVNIEVEPPTQYHGQFDVVLSTNCIHATRNLPVSLKNINKLLRPHGFVALVEFTTRMFWFDLVFGLLEGWWRFDDGRDYVLAQPEFWDKCLREASFRHVSWTGGSTRESEVVRLITGFKQPVRDPSLYRSIPQANSWPYTRLGPVEQSDRPSKHS